MAQTVNSYGKTITVTIADTSDWLWSSIQSTPGKLLGVGFYPGAAGDKLIVRNGSIAGPFVVLESLDGEPRYQPMWGVEFSPCIDYSECTFSTTSSFTFCFAGSY